MKTLYLLSTILLISSCAIHTGTTTSSTTDEPVVHKDIAVGESSTNIVLGIGGLEKDALISRARRNMTLTRPLEGAEQFNNIDVNIKNTYYILGRRTKVTVKADVVEPKDSVNQATYTDSYLKKLMNTDAQTEFYAVGDSVVIVQDYSPVKGKISHIHGAESNKRIGISYNMNGSDNMKKLASKRVFLIIPEYFGLKLGQYYEGGIVLGFGMKHVLINTPRGPEPFSYPE